MWRAGPALKKQNNLLLAFMDRIPAYILGATGFTAAELLRLLFDHPVLDAAGVVSTSSPDKSVASIHPHLAASYPDLATISWDDALKGIANEETVAIFSALPHGHSAASLTRLFSVTNGSTYTVDLSADYRLTSASQFEEIYGVVHPAPAEMESFVCGVPEHALPTDSHRAAHPGCFTTSVVLATVPLSVAGSSPLHCRLRRTLVVTRQGEKCASSR